MHTALGSQYLPQSYWISLKSGKCVLMLHWMRWSVCVCGEKWEDRTEEKWPCWCLRQGGGWQVCMVIGFASTGGMTKVNLWNESTHLSVTLLFSAAIFILNSKSKSLSFTCLWHQREVEASPLSCGWLPSGLGSFPGSYWYGAIEQWGRSYNLSNSSCL